MVLVAVQLSVLGLYLPPVFNGARIVTTPAPDDHFAAGPDCRVTVSGSGRIGGAGGCPTIGARIISAAGVQVAADIRHIRPRRSFHCRSTPPCDRSTRRRIGGAGAVQVSSVHPPSSEIEGGYNRW